MTSPNPFAYVNSLHTFIDELCLYLASGEDVIALVGPYDSEEIRLEVENRMRSPLRCTTLESSRDVTTGSYRGLTLVRFLQDSYAQLVRLCSEVGAKFVMAPTGVSPVELGGYGLTLMAGCTDSEVYQDVIIDLASRLSGGSPIAFQGIVRSYIEAALRRRQFVDPNKIAKKFGSERTRRLCEERSYHLDDMRAFLYWLQSVAGGYFQTEEVSQSTFLWAWSLGMCWRVEGVWNIDWSVISFADGSLPNASIDEDLAEARTLMRDLGTRRVGIAENAAFMPVLDRYCLMSSARYACRERRMCDERSSPQVPSRAAQISDIREFSMRHPDNWSRFVGRPVNMYQIKELRNRLCHLKPGEVDGNMLEALQSAIMALTDLEERPYSSMDTCSFM